MNLKMLAARIKELREKAGLSQKELAEKAGLSQRSVSNWEQGTREPGWLAVLALAEALGVDCKAFEQGPGTMAKPKRGRPAKGKPEAKKKAKDKRRGKP